MNGTTVDMTRGSPRRLILSFALPILLSQVFQQLYNTADALIVGRFLGDEALAAVSSSGTLIFLMVSFFVGASMGAGIVISHRFGARDYDSMRRAIHTHFALGIAAGLLLTVVGVWLTPTFLRWIRTDPAVLPDAIEYFRYFFLGAIAFNLYNVCRGTMTALGDSRRPLYYLIFSSVTNVVLDVLFIGVFRWGVWAAAAATVISQALSVALCLVHLMKPGTLYQLRLRELRFDRQMTAEIFRNGLPAGVQNSVIALANVIVQSNINAFGKVAMAAYGSYSKIEGFVFLPIMSFGMATTTFISQNLGAKEYERARRGARFGIVTSVVMAEVIGVAVYAGGPALIRLFSDTPEVIAAGTQQCRVAALFYCLLAYSNAVANVLRGAGKAFVPMLVMILCWCALRIAYITLILRLIPELRMIYWAYPITWGVSSILYFIYYHTSDWLHGFDRAAGRTPA